MTYSYFEGVGLAWQWPFPSQALPLIIVKFPSCDFLEHLFIVCIIHLTLTRSGLVELINFPYFWITYIGPGGQFLYIFLFLSQYWAYSWAQETNDGFEFQAGNKTEAI